mmetsp:Transcript_16371/g.48792  ORF Transcript_16371/g.48792 Transcript_16371/m.48792 type:complete len:225 (-) Transcript_16371:1535-2209(-)
MGAGLSARCDRHVRPSQLEGRGDDPRAGGHGAALPRQQRRRPLRDQGHDAIHGQGLHGGGAAVVLQEDVAAAGHAALCRAGDPVRRHEEYQLDRAKAAPDLAGGDPHVCLQVQRPTVREVGEDRRHGTARLRAERGHDPVGVPRVRLRGRHRVRPEVRAGHRPVRHQAEHGDGALRRRAAGADPDEGELCRPGSHCGGQGHLQEVPRAVRVHHRRFVPEPREPG